MMTSSLGLSQERGEGARSSARDSSFAATVMSEGLFIARIRFDKSDATIRPGGLSRLYDARRSPDDRSLATAIQIVIARNRERRRLGLRGACPRAVNIFY